MAVRIKVFAGPNDYDARLLYQEEEGELLVGVDSGLDRMLEARLPIDIAVGDFDSIDPAHVDAVKKSAGIVLELPAEKNVTDLAFALDYLYNHHAYDSIVIYGGIGGRVDHLVANINLMKKYDLVFEDGTNRMFTLRKGTHTIDNRKRYISFFAVEDCFDLSIRGFRYDLDHYYLGTDDSLCVSNEGSGIVTFSKGRLLVIEADDPTGLKP
ncbi:MAG TPA: thiamine diphosphokinase [Acholeplasmatales bacterium]|nr:MAG: thiamine diphosphokinase [Tenericutes bacterium GWF2_57_13]HAQ56401.1 thiamine diphosphokinase [Acholeplasmatales bacterium]